MAAGALLTQLQTQPRTEVLAELVDIADTLADTGSVTAGLRRLAAGFVVEVRLHDQFGHIVARAGDVRGTPVLRIPLLTRDHDLGALEIVAATRLAPDAADFIGTAARLLVLQILRDRSRLEARLELRSEFVAALLGDPRDHHQQLRRDAALLGLDLSAPAVVLRVAEHGDAGTAGTDPEQVVRAVGRAAAEQLGRAVVAVHERAVVLVANAEGAASAVRAGMQRLVALASSRLARTPLCAGLGRPCAHLEEYAEAHRQAAVALQVALEQPDPRLVACDELGIYGLLASAAPCRSLHEFVAQTLGTLMEADAHSSCDYVNTLSVFLSCDRNLERTARALYVHVNTVRYRLARAREISGLDLRDVETRFRVELAVRARDALRLAADEAG